MLPNVDFLGLMVLVSWLIGAEADWVAGVIITVIFLSLAVSLFMVLMVFLLGHKPAVIVDSGSNTINGL
jgi:hypothetical protein